MNRMIVLERSSEATNPLIQPPIRIERPEHYLQYIRKVLFQITIDFIILPFMRVIHFQIMSVVSHKLIWILLAPDAFGNTHLKIDMVM